MDISTLFNILTLISGFHLQLCKQMLKKAPFLAVANFARLFHHKIFFYLCVIICPKGFWLVGCLLGWFLDKCQDTGSDNIWFK